MNALSYDIFSCTVDINGVVSKHVESCDQVDIHGPAGGVSHMIVGDDRKHRVRHINDMSYII